MHDDPPGQKHPARLLDDYVTVARSREPGTLAATALRMRSADARAVLARAAMADRGDLDELLAAARAGDVDWLRRQLGHTLPDDLAELARVIALQQLHETDLADAVALFDLIIAAFGPDRISPGYQGLHCELALCTGAYDRVRHLLGVYPRLPDMVRRNVRIDLANPFVADPGGDEDAWFAALRALLPPGDVTFARAGVPGGEPFDRVTGGRGGTAVAGPLISVILTAYRPGPGLRTAVRSLLAQTWTNLEVLVVDDGSPGEFDSVLGEAVALDARVRLVRCAVNAGTYAARSAGLAAAAGEFVTFQDSDDWSHPGRLAHQAGPLLAEPELAATTSMGLVLTGNLQITRAGRAEPRRLNTSSLMFRRVPVMDRIGFFDTVRKAADSEYMYRIKAAFGEAAVRHLYEIPYALIRLAPGSLSRGDFRVGWAHPARKAYVDAYTSWHERIRSGAADPYRPRDAVDRAFRAPRHIAGARGPRPRYDVVFAGDWCRYGGPQKSMLEEIRALTARGMRVAVMHLEALRFMSRAPRALCPPIVDLLDRGVVEQVFLTDEVDVAVLMIRYPPVVQFAPDQPSAISAGAVVILANQAPRERDGRDWRYVPSTCAAHARRLFGVQPLWCPQGPAVRAEIAGDLPGGAIAPFDIPGIIDARRWRIDRTGFRSTRPVLGKHSRDHWTKWPADRETLLRVYPGDGGVDVRFMGGAKAARAVLGGEIPSSWCVYQRDQVDVRSFLHQLDFFVYYPHPDMVEAFGRAVLEALAAGCVAVLPPHFRDTFGDAAVYCDAADVPAVIERYRDDRDLFLAQSRAAQDRVERTWSHARYAELMTALVQRSPLEVTT
ncbi:hypothetical protein GCM10012284_49290 [Mangrovihabitans endophyticus]|uniref:Glycosyltransferase 2-like domain-containing protein n=2 Tax=Mangrovihabitans endophyticus TaxID=1751298 RepID=A0A8J3FQP1_9ACTN|nr:hypothetical protein GCM10012284_49290 [Mangrovihabitans endophyticus]